MISIELSTALSLVAAAAGVVCVIAILRLNRTVSHWRERCAYLEASLPGLEREIERFASISVRTGRQVKRIESEYSDFAERVDTVEQRGSRKALDEAIVAARRGADTRSLAQQFGLSRGEAELVTRLHGRTP